VDQSELVAQLLAGDRIAGRRFYEAHAPRIYRLVYRLVGDAHLAQDLTQDIFVRALRALEDFRGDASLFTWLHRIAISVTCNALRQVRRQRVREVAANDTETMEELMHEAAAAHASVDPDLVRRVAQEAEKLPEVLRLTLIMHDVEGYTHGEIAAVLNVPEGTCRARLSTARTKLRRALAAYQESCDP
jgi:RNA polymerase sigma-70 factor (ECF subfamily)